MYQQAHYFPNFTIDVDNAECTFLYKMQYVQSSRFTELQEDLPVILYNRKVYI